MREEPVFRKRGSSGARQTLPEEAPSYLFSVSADHALVGTVEATMGMVMAAMVVVAAGTQK